jgi:hypothetical protein
MDMGKAMPESKRLAENLSGSPSGCPIPSAHDKLAEAHYFIHEMIDKYHYPHEFRYSLSGFLQAARSTTLILQAELGSRPGFDRWYGQHRQELASDGDIRLLNELRVRVVHQNSLVPASSMFAGCMRYGKPKSGLLMPFDPMTSTLVALVEVRRALAGFVHPHRLWVGEEFGVQRKWSLREINGRELVQFCMACWRKISKVIAGAHAWTGAALETKMQCETDVGQAQVLTESEIFPEVAKAWDGPPTEIVAPRERELLLLREPVEGADCLHVITAPTTAKGWATPSSRYWPRPYASMLLYSTGKEVTSDDTCVFFARANALVSVAPREED